MDKSESNAGVRLSGSKAAPPPFSENPFPQDLVVRLRVHIEGDFVSINCEVCHKIVLAGTAAAIQEALDTLLARIAPLHLHGGM